MIPLVVGLVVSVVLLGCAAGPVLDLLRRSAVGPGTAIACWTAALAGTFIAAKWVNLPKCAAASSTESPESGTLSRRAITSAMLRNDTPSSATAW